MQCPMEEEKHSKEIFVSKDVQVFGKLIPVERTSIAP